MFLNAPLASSIDSHQCVRFLQAHSTRPCFELTDRIIVICSLSSPKLFDPYKPLRGKIKQLWSTHVRVLTEATLQFILFVKEVRVLEGFVEWRIKLHIRHECFCAPTRCHVFTCLCSYVGEAECSGGIPLIQELSWKQFRNSSQDTLQRQQCFVASPASSLPNRLSAVIVCVL